MLNVVGTMFFKDGKLLIDKPRKRPTFQMIGGAVEEGETILEAAIRECHEELGDKAIFATQTTLSVDETAKTVAALKERFPQIEGPKTDDTCFATQHRQGAVKKLAEICDVVLVAGSKNSSNSNRLREVAASCGAQAYLVEDHTELKPQWFEGIKAVGLTAGASVPEYVVDGILDFLKEKGHCDVEEVGEAPVKRTFALPSGI